MMLRIVVCCAAAGMLAGCVGTTGTGTERPAVPEAVALLAAPHQDLSTARVLPEDGCYWYEHVGPVETTLIPLVSTSGRPICTEKS